MYSNGITQGIIMTNLINDDFIEKLKLNVNKRYLSVVKQNVESGEEHDLTSLINLYANCETTQELEVKHIFDLEGKPIITNQDDSLHCINNEVVTEHLMLGDKFIFQS